MEAKATAPETTTNNTTVPGEEGIVKSEASEKGVALEDSNSTDKASVELSAPNESSPAENSLVNGDAGGGVDGDGKVRVSGAGETTEEATQADDVAAKPRNVSEDSGVKETDSKALPKTGEIEQAKVDSAQDLDSAKSEAAVGGNIEETDAKGTETVVDESASLSNDNGTTGVESTEPDVTEKNVKLVANNSLAKTEIGQDKNGVQEKPAEETSKEPQNGSIEEGGNAESGDVVAETVDDTGTLGKEDIQKEEQDIKENDVPDKAQDVTSQTLDQTKSAEGDIEGSAADGDAEEKIFGSSEAAKQFLEELEKAAGVGSHSTQSNDQSDRVDGQIVMDSDEEVDTDEEGEGKELFDSAALAALLKAATGNSSDGSSASITSQDGSRLFTVERPAGLGSSLRAVKPAARRSSLFGNLNPSAVREADNILSEEEKTKLEKLQQLRVKFLRLVHRLGQSVEDAVAAQVLYRLALLAGRQTGEAFSLEAAKTRALQLEEEARDDMDFSLTILVLGKAGVGKSATINSLFGDQKARIDAFEPATTKLREIIGMVDGVKVRVIDTPGLKSSAMEQCANRKILSSIKKKIKKCPPDVVLYVDRLDSQTRDLNDLPLLRTVVAVLGSATWRNAIVALTHAASAPPDGPSGSPLSYDVFVAQRSHVVQQSIGQAIGDLRYISASFSNPVALVENHPSCRKNRDGQKVLPNGQTWRPQLLLLCYSMKFLAEANSVAKPYDPFSHSKLFGFRVRSPPLPYLLSWLLQSRTHPKLPADQGLDAIDSDIDLDDVSDSDREDGEDEYDQLPPFKPLRRAQLAKLSREQKKAYFEEYDYRVKLFQKKQWKEELKRMRDSKKKGKVAEEEYGEEDSENGAPAAVPVPLPDMALPPSFDSDYPAYRYRFLEPTSQLLTRPVLDTHGWDHDCGYDGVNIEQNAALVNRFPASVTVQLTKDKKEFNIHMDSSIATKHGENRSSMAGFDIQNVGRQLAYVVRGETKFKALSKNKAAVGASVTFIGENVATGVKLEDQISLGKRLALVGSTGTVRSQSDSAYGLNVELRLREADFPIGQDQSSLSVSLVKWKGDLALGTNVQSQFSVGRASKINVRAGLNNKRSGQITVRTSSSDQLQIALAAVLPVAMTIYKSLRPATSEKRRYPMY